MNELYNVNAEIFNLDLNNRGMPFSDSVAIIDMLSANYQNGMYPTLENIKSTNIIFFINSNMTDDFFEKKYMPYFTPVKIRKVCSEATVTDIHRDEIIWVYSVNPEIHKIVRAFDLNKELLRSGVSINVEKGSFIQSID